MHQDVLNTDIGIAHLLNVPPLPHRHIALLSPPPLRPPPAVVVVCCCCLCVCVCPLLTTTPTTVYRDFTVNALYYDPATNQVLDFVGGVEDALSRTLRLCHDDTRRLTEDPLRVLRGVRFATVLGLKLSPGTAGAMRQHAHMCSLNAGALGGCCVWVVGCGLWGVGRGQQGARGAGGRGWGTAKRPSPLYTPHTHWAGS